MKRIWFEDKGQAVLFIEIEGDKIVDCGPATDKKGMWVGGKVLNPNVEAGSYIEFRKPHEDRITRQKVASLWEVAGAV